MFEEHVGQDWIVLYVSHKANCTSAATVWLLIRLLDFVRQKNRGKCSTLHLPFLPPNRAQKYRCLFTLVW